MKHRASRAASVIVLLLLSASLLGLWDWSYRAEIHVGCSTRAGRFTARLSRGGIDLWGPPAPASHTSALLERLAEPEAASLRNDQIFWGRVVLVNNQAKLSHLTTVIPGTASWEVLQLGDVNVCIRPLLKALDDPNRFGAAHCLLTFMTAPRMLRGRVVLLRHDSVGIRDQLASDAGIQFDAMGRIPPHSIRLDCNGLRIDLWPNGATPDRSSFPMQLQGNPMFRLDSTCLGPVREYWHRKLDVRVGYLPAWVLPLLAVAGPSVLTLRKIKRRVAARRGRCRLCGYSLTGNTSGVCPECGTPVAGKVEAKA